MEGIIDTGGLPIAGKWFLVILINSEGAIKFLYLVVISSMLQGGIRNALKSLGDTMKFIFLWFPGHRNMEGSP